ncbi:hypothetical protein M427DRAFT_27582 [Gonapodya prolifera JEL478]|uniref:Cilia- and flagella-associated protein 418 n=1 Tax=Gonapodya prolifera (strain JEL478) TaxID=1344416 RepID=A0A139AXF2_GONPJ|nr:hypothetical protein M427DRAFT_27582 [Gonapodya prolifera JEL478]|eukprot:KXS21135.1 hypothetical protein M427DRAFT_27582 [Gonapodya prolifera JEL478]
MSCEDINALLDDVEASVFARISPLSCAESAIPAASSEPAHPRPRSSRSSSSLIQRSPVSSLHCSSTGTGTGTGTGRSSPSSLPAARFAAPPSPAPSNLTASHTRLAVSHTRQDDAVLSRTSSFRQKKCSPPYLGRERAGGLDSISVNVSISACDRLRCTSCDLACISIPDAEWTPRADYIFFRNFHPDVARLMGETKRTPGSTAYCCQCTGVSVSGIVKLSDVDPTSTANFTLRPAATSGLNETRNTNKSSDSASAAVRLNPAHVVAA